MQTSKRRRLKSKFTAGILSACLAAVLLWYLLPTGQTQSAGAGVATNAASTSLTATNTNSPSALTSTNTPNGSTNASDGAAVEPRKLPTDLIQLSFQNMQIDQVIQWLSENTGKSVIKFPTAHCQITIIGTKKVTREEAVTMVYRALNMEGFNAIETSDSILIVPSDQDMKLNLSPELIGESETNVPGGRERLVRVFPLQYLPPAEITEKVRSVLSTNAVVVTDDRANLMIVTDYNDNLAAAARLISALDVEKNDDVIVRAINLKNVAAAELAKEIQPLYQKLTGRQSKEIIEVSASDTANSLMVLSSAANFKEIEKVCHFPRHGGRARKGHEDLCAKERRRAGRGQTIAGPGQ